MPDRPDLRRIAADIREALESYPREALADILTYVFQAYVVEGAPVVHAAQPERLAELEGLSFPELVQALQVRLDLPELSLFEVQHGRVHVRVGGALVPLVAGADPRRTAASPLPPAAPSTPASVPAAPAATVPVASVGAPTPSPAIPAPTTEHAEVPRPARGVSVNPSRAPAAPGAPPPRPATAPGSPPAPRTPATQPAADADAGEDDLAARRFRLLEID